MSKRCLPHLKKSPKVKGIKVRTFGPKGIKVGPDFLKVKGIEVVLGGARPPGLAEQNQRVLQVLARTSGKGQRYKGIKKR